jgi:hypothetical protein
LIHHADAFQMQFRVKPIAPSARKVLLKIVALASHNGRQHLGLGVITHHQGMARDIAVRKGGPGLLVPRLSVNDDREIVRS